MDIHKKPLSFVGISLMFGFMVGFAFSHGVSQTSPTGNALSISLSSPGIGLYATLALLLVFILVIVFAIKVINH